MTIALIDGDIVAYMGASLAEEEAFPPLPGQDPDDAKPTASWANCRRIMKDIMDKWEYLAGATESRVALTDRSTPRASFRYQVHPHYKNQRTKGKPILLEKAEAYLIKRYAAESCPGLEGDDLLSMWATSGAYDDAVVVSKDKDMLTIPTKVLIIPHAKTTDGLHPKKITKSQALDNLFRQVVTGDTVDNYLGAPGVGPKGAETWLLDGGSRWDRLVACYEWAWENRPRYHDRWVHPGDAEAEALMNFRCARLLADGDYEYNKRVRMWAPGGKKEWLSL